MGVAGNFEDEGNDARQINGWGIPANAMISNERTWPSQRNHRAKPNHRPLESRPPRPFSAEDTLKTGELDIERKHFVLMLKQNPRGRFLRIIEAMPGRSNSIIIPATGLSDFKKLLDEIVKAAHDIPPLKTPAIRDGAAISFSQKV